MTQYHFMLWPDGSWCDLDSATDYLKNTGTWMEVTGHTTPIQMANHLDDEKMLGTIIKEMLG